MIDWAKVRIPHPHTPITGGSILTVCPSGEVTKEIALSMPVTGSYDSRMMVSSYGSLDDYTATHLILNGNPSKFLQGHNVIGIDDISLLIRLSYHKICETLGLIPYNYEDSDVRLSWVDINYMYQLPSLIDVRAWLAAAEFSARSRSGRAVMSGSTVYLQKHSRRWAIKFYSKYDEFAVHPLPEELADSGLIAYSENLLRVELRLFAKELEKIGVKTLADLPTEKVQQIYGDYMSKIILTDRVRLPAREAMDLPTSLRSTYTLWYDGHDIRSMLPRNTFYRHRRSLLQHGVDISMTAPTQKTNNVIPLMRTLTASQVQIPAWAYERKLIAGGN